MQAFQSGEEIEKSVLFDDLLHFTLLFAVACLACVINTLAGGGSYLTLAVLMGLGLPPGVANATNRVGILAGLVTGSWKFARLGQLRKSDFLQYCLPAAVGGLGGAYVVILLDDRTLRAVLAVLMLLGTWTILRQPKADPSETGQKPRPMLGAGLFTGVGFYAGFIQAGTGFIALAATSLLGIDLKRGNAIKVVSNLVQTIPTLLLFAHHSLVDWKVGLVLALGMAVGGWFGAALSHKSRTDHLRKFIAVAIVFSALAVLAPLLGFGLGRS